MQANTTTRRNLLTKADRNISRPSQMSADEALKKLAQSTVKPERKAMPEGATINPRGDVPKPRQSAPVPVSTVTVDAQSRAEAKAEAKRLANNFARTGEYPGEALKALSALAPEADAVFAHAVLHKVDQLSPYSSASISLAMMNAEFATAVAAYAMFAVSPVPIQEKWQARLGKTMVDRAWAGEMSRRTARALEAQAVAKELSLGQFSS